MPDTTRHPSAGAMSDGSHLSIGEVLALLLEEFPDVTISKIRFLESQGLIDPERTPSGYRKFFEPDVELLRVILREQRENYLPLRVIKDRIHSGQLDAAGEQPAPQGIPGVDAEPSAATANVDAGRDDAEAENAPEDTAASAVVAELAEDVELAQAVDVESRPAVEVEAPPAGVEAVIEPEPVVGTDADAPSTEPPPLDHPADALVEAVRAAGAADPVPPPAAPSAPEPASSRPAPATPQLLPGVSVNVDELAAMVGATREEVAQLEDYGIVSGRDSLGERIFDEDAVEITKVAVEFLRGGVDARHLRGWKTSADREASVYEQLILPLLRQRNPESRVAARDQLQRMSELGGSLRAALMRAALRGHLGG